MDPFAPSEFKTALHSKRARLYYIRDCRVLVDGGRVEYLSDEGNHSSGGEIPVAPTTVLLLGTGTSVTQAAMHELARAGVMVGFCGKGGPPFQEPQGRDGDMTWFCAQSDSHPTEYLQHWVRFWFDEGLRLEAAKALQRIRLTRIAAHWVANRQLAESGFVLPAERVHAALGVSRRRIDSAQDNAALLAEEARLSHTLYKLACDATAYEAFSQTRKDSGADPAQSFVAHGKHLACGLAASAACVLGLPHGLAVLHGKHRRGGLVVDIADLVKDALILPQAFVSALRGDDEQRFREACVTRLQEADALDFMIDTAKAIAIELGRQAGDGWR